MLTKKIIFRVEYQIKGRVLSFMNVKSWRFVLHEREKDPRASLSTTIILLLMRRQPRVLSKPAAGAIE